MEYRTLGNLVNIQKGKKNLVTDFPDENSNRIIQIEDLRNNNNKQYTNDNNGIEVNEEDLLIVWDGANAGLVGFGKKGYLGSTLAVLRKKENIFVSKYVGRFLKTKFDYFQETSTGATVPHISRLALEELVVPLPSYTDQIRIAWLLENIEALIAKRKKTIDLLDELAKSVFYQFFGDPVGNEKGWKKEAIGSLGKVITGNTPSRTVLDYYNPPFIEWIKTDNIVADKIYLSKSSENLSELGMEFGRTVDEGALLVSCIAGSLKSIGRVAIANRKVAFNQQINAIGFNDQINPIFVYWQFKLSESYIQSFASGAMKYILSKSEFEKIDIINPDYNLQNQFASFAQKIETLKNEQQLQLQDMEELYASISQKVFAGGLDLSKIPVDKALLSTETVITQPGIEENTEGEEDADNNTFSLIEKEKTPKPQKGKAIQTDSSKEASKPIQEKESTPNFTLNWGTISFKEVAYYISQHFGEHYFNAEMLLRYLEEVQGIQVQYFTSAEQKKNPQYEQADDFLSFVSGAITGQNTFMQLEQVFYNAETENIPNISFTINDLETLAGKAKKDRSGIYFRIKDEVTPG